MKNYINILDTSEEDREHKLSFNNNTISLDTLSNTEKNIKKLAVTPRKTKPNLSYIILTKNGISKEIPSEDNNSSGNNSDKNINKLFNIKSKQNTFTDEKENKRYINVKESNDNNIQKKHIRKDVYGKEIKKGGNHRVTFADNVQMIKSRIKLEESHNTAKNENNNDSIGDNKIKRVRTLKKSLLDLKNIKKMQEKFDMERTERKKMKLVDVIEIENYKEYNKNDYLYPQYGVYDDLENKIDNQEAICCTGICFVF